MLGRFSERRVRSRIDQDRSLLRVPSRASEGYLLAEYQTEAKAGKLEV